MIKHAESREACKSCALHTPEASANASRRIGEFYAVFVLRLSRVLSRDPQPVYLVSGRAVVSYMDASVASTTAAKGHNRGIVAATEVDQVTPFYGVAVPHNYLHFICCVSQSVKLLQ